jgi:glycosyltransferase involved in cell wall biosynthesis
VQQAVESCFEGNDGINVDIVVDGGCTDGTREYLKSTQDDRVQPISQEHQRAQATRNRGQQAARGRAIKYLDDDDYLCPGSLVKEFRRLIESERDLCYGDYWIAEEPCDEWTPFTQPAHEDFLLLFSRNQ